MNPLFTSLSIIPIVGVISQWIAWRIRFPSIIILLMGGFLVGPVLNILDSDALFGDLLYPVVTLLVSVIVFEGGLNLRVRELKSIGAPLLALVTVGPMLTIGLMYLATHYILGFPVKLSIMFSSLMVITGPTVIIPILRHISVHPKMSSLIRWEGILIAPIGTILIVLVYQSVFITTEPVLKVVAFTLVKTLATAILISTIASIIFIQCFKRNWVPEFLQELITLILVISTFLITNIIQSDSGVLAVVLLGIILANQQVVSVQNIKVFKENLRILSISTLFIVLSSRLNMHDLQVLFDLKHGIYLLVILFIVRPVSTLTSLLKSSLSMKERLLMAWMAPRGIVTASIASLFSLRLVNMGIDRSEELVPLTFLVLIFTVFVYGFSLNPFIRFFKINENQGIGVLILGANPVAIELAKLINNVTSIEVTVVDSNKKNIQRAKLDQLNAKKASIFSSKITEDLQMGAHKYFISATENDEINTLACIQHAETIGKHNVFRLPPVASAASYMEKYTMQAGHILFEKIHTYQHLKEAIQSNKRMKLITLIATISMDEFKSIYGNQSVPLLGVDPSNNLILGHQVKEFKQDEQWIMLV